MKTGISDHKMWHEPFSTHSLRYSEARLILESGF
jgi:hypothetical protein